MNARYYAVNDRPVALVPTPDGGLDCLVFDFATASMVPDRSYFARVSDPGIGKDVDAMTEDGFAEAVARWRRDLLHGYERTHIAWERTGDPAAPYRHRLPDRTLTLRANGDGAAFTLLSEDNEVGGVAEWPPAWERPAPEGLDRRARSAAARADQVLLTVRDCRPPAGGPRLRSPQGRCP